ncbi:MAG: type II toxin-antitoxin system RelE/ParE family toxin [Gammaproteobacteria bacterium]|jgi:putative addiction module killer protein|nr:type II toxin-antitoxin system RelE/ParE family toxin [Gammaproteobacteria bacterium]MBT3844526.1 type II toxin-antitoxin system RelE/ParE family toxin [Gammaproteobacteria bacterium]MBT3892762.1 type II toxin-antitoxin system RelE/ParE family toxin [Gammaproteobacteria bacterium]MBT5371852.1 type II toxin-antitoxin system RelE/ParE family toxin [Gammaproteobacteria bacterium]MBT5688518.1 type II toxin-antitoxin system RelE/ParE family toxin [Gammaproteobacteria bacterium]
MYLIQQTSTFAKWFKKLKDQNGKATVLKRLSRLKKGHWGDHKSVGEGIEELRIFSGPGYRLYCSQQETQLVILLCGGDKSSQQKDIEQAKLLLKEIRNGRTH